MKKSRKSHSEIDFWQSNTDLMTGLVLMLLLVIMLLVLYLLQIPEAEEKLKGEGENYNIDNEIGDTVGETYPYPEGEDNDDDNDDGGGGDGGEEKKEEYEFPFPSSGGGEEWSKSAVYATVIDKETGRAIREEGITFELYEEQRKGDGGSLRFLNTYYPVKTEYRDYETTENGVFYLPEKVETGNYYFKQITELEGYDPAEAVYFTVDDIYDWPDPFVVSIEVVPCKNIISVMLEDKETHMPVSESTFKVTAAEDILTADSTVRYAKNELADTISLDAEGYGESQELYLGKYVITQEKIPQYYAGIRGEEIETEVEKKGRDVPETLKFLCEKTKISLQLTDALYTNQKLEGAEFTLVCDGRPELNKSAVTDKNGKITFTDLEKNTTYHLKQNSAPAEYQFDSNAADIYVEENGYIGDETEALFELTNYIARVSIYVKDKLLSKPVSDESVSLYDSDKKKIRTWTSSGKAEIFENLPGGTYYVQVGKNKKYEISVARDEILQEISVTVLTTRDIIIASLGVGGLLVVFIVFGMLLKKKKRVSEKEIDEK